MSGGVDSSVCAVFLQKQGYEVVGAFMKNWSDGDDSAECSWRTERRDAQRVAWQLGLEFHTFDFEKEYREQVYEYMIREYEIGRTPNPDVLCNKYMKFGLFMQKAVELDCDLVATGHYARIKQDIKGVFHLYAGKDKDKDQSYFLCRLEQNQLKKILFPIGDLQKTQVRKIAKKVGLTVADKKESQGICFVGKVALADFLKERIVPKKGNIIDTQGNVLGEHEGHMYYTIGQRHGFNLPGGPWFVAERKQETNELVVAKADEISLFQKELVATEITETIPENLEKYIGKRLQARIRYRQPLQKCRITKQSIADDKTVITVEFSKQQRAVAPGQFIAFYKGKELLGSGIIKR